MILAADDKLQEEEEELIFLFFLLCGTTPAPFGKSALLFADDGESEGADLGLVVVVGWVGRNC